MMCTLVGSGGDTRGRNKEDNTVLRLILYSDKGARTSPTKLKSFTYVFAVR